MLSSIKIDFKENEVAKGLQPVIVVKIAKNSDDPRDKLLQSFFEKQSSSPFFKMEYIYDNNHMATINQTIHITPIPEKEVINAFSEFKKRFDQNFVS